MTLEYRMRPRSACKACLNDISFSFLYTARADSTSYEVIDGTRLPVLLPSRSRPREYSLLE